MDQPFDTSGSSSKAVFGREPPIICNIRQDRRRGQGISAIRPTTPDHGGQCDLCLLATLIGGWKEKEARGELRSGEGRPPPVGPFQATSGDLAPGRDNTGIVGDLRRSIDSTGAMVASDEALTAQIGKKKSKFEKKRKRVGGGSLVNGHHPIIGVDGNICHHMLP
ncbi:hypothetical protein CRG98_033266 [Punica granatum]|uniref:Uncharacterized protein n=1 Tax=Punica granatum TaxID=22663 RepID=A0A2I0IQU6_PUNGR|nr:hypothetical protein CRG98_033266 [Punica granatum]